MRSLVAVLLVVTLAWTAGTAVSWVILGAPGVHAFDETEIVPGFSVALEDDGAAPGAN